VRVYAEDPENNFLPDIGKLNRYAIPKGVGIRVDDGFEEGMTIPIYYDPMIAKLITYGQTRTEAIERMVRAIDDYKIEGIKTTLPFCKFVMQHTAFVSGKYDTHFVQNYFTPERLSKPNENETIAALMSAYLLSENNSKKTIANQVIKNEGISTWQKHRM
ncbi:MAG TPA: biotin carboxylase, partial [Bacteroidales bacterium]|nr:biotin carboxylase [Bacteroidales bacterium]